MDLEPAPRPTRRAKRRLAPEEATIEEDGNESGPFRQPPAFNFQEWQASCRELFPSVLTRLLRKDILHEPPPVEEKKALKLPKRFVHLWKAFDEFPSDKKCLGAKCRNCCEVVGFFAMTAYQNMFNVESVVTKLHLYCSRKCFA